MLDHDLRRFLVNRDETNIYYWAFLIVAAIPQVIGVLGRKDKKQFLRVVIFPTVLVLLGLLIIVTR